MTDESFSNNPFRGLKGRKDFPAKSTAGRETEALMRRARKARKPVSQEEARDTELFLRAMDGVEPEKESGHAVKGRSHGEPRTREVSPSPTRWI